MATAMQPSTTFCSAFIVTVNISNALQCISYMAVHNDQWYHETSNIDENTDRKAHFC